MKAARRVLRGPDLALNTVAHNLSRWTVRIGHLDTIPAPTTVTDDSGDPDKPDRKTSKRPRKRPDRKDFVATDTLRRRYLAAPGRLATSSRRLHLHLPARWPTATKFLDALTAIRAVKIVT